MQSNNHAIRHRILITGIFVPASPIRIANGKGDHADLILLKDHKGFPYVPGSSIAGVLRAKWARTEFDRPVRTQTAAYFWGNSAKPGEYAAQSHFRVHNLKMFSPKDAVTTIRDGVSIDPATGTVDGSKKYDYEILEPGNRLSFRSEILVRDGIPIEEVYGIIHWLEENLKNDLQVGGNTTKGFGRLECRGLKCFHFDFSTASTRKSDATAWLEYCRSGKTGHLNPIQIEHKKYSLGPRKAKDLVVEARFELDHSLIIGGPGPLQSYAQKTHLHSKANPVISGSSLMGALRQRAGRILEIAKVEQANAKLNHLFGFKGEVTEKTPPKRSRVETRESLVKDAKPGVQTRIRVDRFTHAPVKGGLFDSEPLWPNGKTSTAPYVDFYWRIRDFQDGEAALLLHLVRDLWTRDLPIGGEKNIGRGRLKGKSISLSAPGFKVSIKEEGGKLMLDDPKGRLSNFNTSLSTLFNQNNHENASN